MKINHLQSKITQIKLTFNDITDQLFSAISIDQTKAVSYREVIRKDTHCIKSVVYELKKGQDLETSKFEEYVQQVLEYIDGQRDKFEFNKKNQFDFISLCDLF